MVYNECYIKTRYDVVPCGVRRNSTALWVGAVPLKKEEFLDEISLRKITWNARELSAVDKAKIVYPQEFLAGKAVHPRSLQ